VVKPHGGITINIEHQGHLLPFNKEEAEARVREMFHISMDVDVYLQQKKPPNEIVFWSQVKPGGTYKLLLIQTKGVSVYGKVVSGFFRFFCVFFVF